MSDPEYRNTHSGDSNGDPLGQECRKCHKLVILNSWTHRWEADEEFGDICAENPTISGMQESLHIPKAPSKTS